MQEVNYNDPNYFLVVSVDIILLVVSDIILEVVSVAILVSDFVVSVVASFFSSLLLPQATMMPAIAKIANTFFMLILFLFFNCPL